MDHAPDRRFRHRRRHQQTLQIPDLAGADGTVDRLRHAHAHGLRLRPPDERWRGGPRRRGRGYARRHGGALRRHRSREHLRIDDHQPQRLDTARHVRGAGREARPRPEQALGHHPGGHTERVYRAEGVHLSDRAVCPHRARLHILLRPQHEALQPDQYLGISHLRSRRLAFAGGRLHHVQPDRLRGGGAEDRHERRRVRAEAWFLLRLAGGPVRGGRQVPGAAPLLRQDHERALRCQEPRIDAASLPLPDRGRDPDQAAIPDQHRAHRVPGPRRGPRRLPVAAHERLRRSVRDSDRGRHAAGPAHAAGHRGGNERHQRHRSAGRFLLPREPDQRVRDAHFRDSRLCG